VVGFKAIAEVAREHLGDVDSGAVQAPNLDRIEPEEGGGLGTESVGVITIPSTVRA